MEGSDSHIKHHSIHDHQHSRSSLDSVGEDKKVSTSSVGSVELDESRKRQSSLDHSCNLGTLDQDTSKKKASTESLEATLDNNRLCKLSIDRHVVVQPTALEQV